MSKIVVCPFCNVEYKSSGIGRHCKTQHNISYKEYLEKNGLKQKRIRVNAEVIEVEGNDKECEYGCETVANFHLKNGKFCCSKSINSCNGMKKKNSKALIGLARSWKGKIHPRKGKPSWNAGKKFSEVLGEKRAKEIGAKISSSLIGKSTGKAATPELELERRRKISENGKGKIGGYRKGSGRGKSGHYKGYWCDSSWELAFVIYHLEHNIPFERNKLRFKYEFEGEFFYYTPDFVMEDGILIEIKGFETKKTLAKYPVVDNLKVLKEKDLKYIIDYTINKYGKDFIKLYESC